MASAYRQLARAPAHESFSIVACWNPAKERHEYFRQRALPFGASASVLEFNWVETALARIQVVGFKVGCTNFHDDYTVIEASHLASSTTTAVDELFALLGWNTKDMAPFGETAEPLGAILDLTDSVGGTAVLRNRPDRVAEIAKEANNIREGACDTRALVKLRRRLIFSRSLCAGRASGAALRALSRAATASLPRGEVPADLRHAMCFVHGWRL